VLAEGLVDMHLTVGEMETKNFENTQNSLMRNQVPYYMKVCDFELWVPRRIVSYEMCGGL
jgi:hypothetical protein